MADDKNPKVGGETHNTDHIKLKVAGQDGSVVRYYIRRHVPLGQVISIYCERQRLLVRYVRFSFDGQPIKLSDTPALLEMQDDHQIEVFLQQTGGAS